MDVCLYDRGIQCLSTVLHYVRIQLFWTGICTISPYVSYNIWYPETLNSEQYKFYLFSSFLVHNNTCTQFLMDYSWSASRLMADMHYIFLCSSFRSLQSYVPLGIHWHWWLFTQLYFVITCGNSIFLQPCNTE